MKKLKLLIYSCNTINAKKLQELEVVRNIGDTEIN